MAAEILKLQAIQRKYEQELQPILLCARNLEEGNIFATFIKDIENNIQNENSTHEEIKEVALLMRNIKHTLISGNSPEIVDLNPKEIKERMIDMQALILDIRKKEKYVLRNLKSEEADLNFDNREIIYEDKIAQWSVPFNFDKLLGKKTIKRSHSCKEVNDFFEFLSKSGGNTQGWSQDDHNIFLKTRFSTKSKQKLISLLHKKLINKSEHEIEKHIDWYSKFLQLKQKKLEALRVWKFERKVDNVASPLSDSTSSTEIKPTKVFDKEGKKKIKKKLSEWKKEKEDKKLLSLKVKQTQRKKVFEKKREKENERTQVKKELVNWQMARTYNEQLDREQKELLEKLDKKYKGREAKKKIKSFQSKDDTYLQKKLIIKQRCRSVEVNKLRPNPKTEAARDPSRLLKPTKQWLNRQSTTSDNGANGLLYINHVSRLAVPEWRKSLG